MAVHPRKAHGQLTVVIKLGTSSIVDEKTHQPLLSILSLIVETAVNLHHAGHRVVIVSSGAIGVGLRRMDLAKRPKHLPKIQALAAIGQCRLMSLWDQLFGHVGQPIAQILLTRNDIADRTQYQNAQNTFIELLNMGVIPIVNENDTLAVTEIKFGDNDTLSAITAGMVQADYLFLMTDVDCLYDKNPRSNPDAKAIEVVEDIADLEADVSSAGSALGTGGMSTKIVAARLATSAGVTTVITRSSKPGNIAAIIRYAESQKMSRIQSKAESEISFDGEGLVNQTSALNLHGHNTPSTSTPQDTPAETPQLQPEPEQVPLHTRFLPIAHPIRDRWFWILHGLAPHGTVYIDHGAWHALSDKAGLLPVGIVDVEGNFAQQEAVRIVVVKRLSSNSHSQHHNSHNRDNHTSSHHNAMANAAANPHAHIHHPTPILPNRHSLYERSPLHSTHTSSTSTPTLTHTRDIHPNTQTAASPHTSPYTTSHTPSRPHSSSLSLSNLSNSGTLPPQHQHHPLYELHNPAPFEIGRAVVNYSAGEIKRIMGLHSTQIHDVLGYAESEYVAWRENVAFFDVEKSRPGTPAMGGRSVSGSEYGGEGH